MEVFTAKSLIKDTLSLHIFKISEIEGYPIHTHEFVEIKYILEGEAVEYVGEQSYEVRRGDLLFIPYGVTHSFTGKKKFSYYNICFAPEVMAKRISNRQEALDLLPLTTLNEMQDESLSVSKLVFAEEERQWIECILKDMLFEYEENNSDRHAVLESYMTVLLAKIVRKTHQVTEVRREYDGVWRALAEFIDENLGQKLTLSALAEKCFYNPSYFSRAFKKKFGMSLVEYIGKERAKLAADLLVTTNYSMEEIAYRCGFGDKTSFYRVFEKQYECTPSQYRQSREELR